jgi:hypothetical protein
VTSPGSAEGPDPGASGSDHASPPPADSVGRPLTSGVDLSADGTALARRLAGILYAG